MTIRTRVVLIAMVVVAFSSASLPASASASVNLARASDGNRAAPGSLLTSCSYYYALQYTSKSAGIDYSGCGRPNPSNEYTGWLGIDGQITTPSSSAPANLPDPEHIAGYLNVEFPNAAPVCGQEVFGSPDAWLQIGWMTGNSQTGYHSGWNMYYEYQYQYNGSCVYLFHVITSLSPGSAITYRIEDWSPDGSGGYCWLGFYNYNQDGTGAICHLPHTGALSAGEEVENWNTNLPMATSYFGTSALNTNQTLRLKGAAGYVNWKAPLTAGYTWESYVLGNQSGQNGYLQSLDAYWYFKTYNS